MKKKNKFLTLFFLILSSILYSQSEPLSRETFIGLVKKFHPVVKQAELQQQIANNGISAAKGNFDPLISGKIGEKKIEQTQYYQQKSIELEVPTWYGINIVGQLNQLSGNRLNASDTKGSTSQIGVEIPLLKGLFFDNRRATLQKAKVFSEMTKNEQQLLINDLLLDAHLAYNDWQKNYKILEINKKTLVNNSERLKMIRKAFQFGERPAIDTTEAISQIQYYQMKFNDAEINFANSQQTLSLYLWNAENDNVLIPKNIIPKLYEEENQHYLYNPNDEIPNNHPALTYYINKENFLKIEQKLKFQSLLPKLDLTYNFIKKSDWDFTPLFQNNFQYGIKLEVPLFLRTARAEYESAKLKVSQNNWMQQQKKAELNAKLQQYKTQFSSYSKQEKVSEENVATLQKLLTGEQIRFQNGESSVFLMNARENKLFEAQEKNIEVKAKFLSSYYKILWVKNEL